MFPRVPFIYRFDYIYIYFLIVLCTNFFICEYGIMKIFIKKTTPLQLSHTFVNYISSYIHMSYVYPQICLTRQGNTMIIEAPFIGSGCGRVVQGAGRKAKRMVLQCGFKSRRGKNKNLTALKSNSNTVWFNFQTYIYIGLQ